MKTVISSAARKVVMGDGLPTVLIGKLQGDAGPENIAAIPASTIIELLLNRAQTQVQAGADAIELTLRGRSDEVELLLKAATALIASLDVPLCLSGSPPAVEEALKVYQGKAILGGCTGDERSLANFLPLAKQYGSAVIIQARNSSIQSGDVSQRVAIAREVLDRVKTEGISLEDVVIDCLPFSPAVEKEGGAVSFETVRRVALELGVNTTISDLHITFGLPGPDLINSSFVTAAVTTGVACLPIDVTTVRAAVLTADVITGRDLNCTRYLKWYRQFAREGK